MTTKTRTALEKLPYAEAVERVDATLIPHLGRAIGNGWVFNGSTPYATKKGKLLCNLAIQQDHYMDPVEEARLFHDKGIDTVVAFLTELGIVGTAHFVVRQEEASIGKKLLSL